MHIAICTMDNFLFEFLSSILCKSGRCYVYSSVKYYYYLITILATTPTSSSSPDADIPHVMISYHWSGQEIMIRVKEKLKAVGYKVWMDVDNMSMLNCLFTMGLVARNITLDTE